MHIVELVKWNGCGTGVAESFAKELVNGVGTFKQVGSQEIDKIFELKNIPLKSLEGEKYYVYYNYHPSSGYKTVLYVNDDKEIAFKVESMGFGLSAMWNEVIVFTVQDRWY